MIRPRVSLYNVEELKKRTLAGAAFLNWIVKLIQYHDFNKMITEHKDEPTKVQQLTVNLLKKSVSEKAPSPERKRFSQPANDMGYKNEYVLKSRFEE